MTEEIEIQGMGCDHCVSAVRQALAGVEGVEVEDVRIGKARIRLDRDVASAEAVDDAIREAGYEPLSHDGGVDA